MIGLFIAKQWIIRPQTLLKFDFVSTYLNPPPSHPTINTNFPKTLLKRLPSTLPQKPLIPPLADPPIFQQPVQIPKPVPLQPIVFVVPDLPIPYVGFLDQRDTDIFGLQMDYKV